VSNTESKAAHVLRRHQVVQGTHEEVFAFFESPWNLEAITPPWLRFEIVDTTDETMRVGTEITYRLKWQGIPMRWRTRIAECEPGMMFADEMTRGPYRRWYHRHSFTAVPGGVEVVDVVEYELPLGWLGRLVHAALVRAQLEAIFDYRTTAVAEIFARRLATGQRLMT
jgi:ligand-binding SRPBCC domain-containing protein